MGKYGSEKTPYLDTFHIKFSTIYFDFHDIYFSLKQIKNNDEQIEELEIYFYTFIFEEEENKELKKNDVKWRDSFGLMFIVN